MSLANLAAWRSYFWPGTEVLRNKLNIRDPDKLAEAEALLTNQRLEEGVPIEPVTPDGYCAIHRHIFQDLYAWAGQYRRANMRHPAHDGFFCKSEFIAAQMADVFARISALPADQLSTPGGFAESLGALLGDLNAIHPFREGNGRTVRVFLAQLAGAHGLAFDQTRLDPGEWNEASRVSFITADTEVLRAVLLPALSLTA